MLTALAMLRRMRSSDGMAPQPSLQRAPMSEALQEGRLRLYCLQIDGRVAALACAMRLRAIEEGAKGLDFLRGEQDYDDELAAGNEQMRVSVFRSAIAAAAFRARRILSSA
jgi:hypothetical protein